MARKAKVKKYRHGSAAGYTYNKCRCALCIQAHTLYMRKYRSGEFARKKSRLANRRAVYRHKLAANWVKENYPDMWQEIVLEAERVYAESLYLNTKEESDVSPG
jgi:hypothetical protein